MNYTIGHATVKWSGNCNQKKKKSTTKPSTVKDVGKFPGKGTAGAKLASKNGLTVCSIAITASFF